MIECRKFVQSIMKHHNQFLVCNFYGLYLALKGTLKGNITTEYKMLQSFYFYSKPIQTFFCDFGKRDLDQNEPVILKFCLSSVVCVSCLHQLMQRPGIFTKFVVFFLLQDGNTAICLKIILQKLAAFGSTYLHQNFTERMSNQMCLQVIEKSLILLNFLGIFIGYSSSNIHRFKKK